MKRKVKWWNRFYTGDNLDILKRFPDESIDLVCFSPPYDNIRTYTGEYSFNYPEVGKELLRVTKEGGVCAVVIQDGTKNFCKSLTTARMQVSWVDQGWKLFECCLYERSGVPGNWWSQRFRVDHEYLLIFFKGKRPKHFDKSSLMIPALQAGRVKTPFGVRTTKGTITYSNEDNMVSDFKCRGTIWNYESERNSKSNKLKLSHPATYPDKLASDIIKCFSAENDIVLDPYSGSGTTCVEAEKLGRRWIGIDIAREYNELARQRMELEAYSLNWLNDTISLQRN